jgi:hypothetical protein
MGTFYVRQSTKTDLSSSILFYLRQFYTTLQREVDSGLSTVIVIQYRQKRLNLLSRFVDLEEVKAERG